MHLVPQSIINEPHIYTIMYIYYHELDFDDTNNKNELYNDITLLDIKLYYFYKLYLNRLFKYYKDKKTYETIIIERAQYMHNKRDVPVFENLITKIDKIRSSGFQLKPSNLIPRLSCLYCLISISS